MLKFEDHGLPFECEDRHAISTIRSTLDSLARKLQSSFQLCKELFTRIAYETEEPEIITDKHSSCSVSFLELDMISSRADMHPKLTCQQAWPMYFAHVIQ